MPTTNAKWSIKVSENTDLTYTFMSVVHNRL